MTSFHTILSRRDWQIGCLLVMFVLCPVSLAFNNEPPADAPKFTPPPAEESTEIRELIDRAKMALQTGRTVSEVLADGTFMPVRAWPRFRALIKENAPTGAVTLVPASEPGVMLIVRGTIRDAGGQPIKGAMIYVYHTSAKGGYSDKAAHISGIAGDAKHARLFAFLKSDAEGRYELRTIRPAGYPATDLPAHIHVEIDALGDKPLSTVTEIRFNDDPRLSPSWRERSKKEGCVISEVRKDANNVQQVVAEIVLR